MEVVSKKNRGPRGPIERQKEIIGFRRLRFIGLIDLRNIILLILSLIAKKSISVFVVTTVEDFF